MEPTPKELLEYETVTGECPFLNWLHELKDLQARAIIRKRLNRVRIGNLGNNRHVGQGVWELKIDFGPGYRVYYGNEGDRIVVLLCGGDKGTQTRDITKAQEYWKDYLTEESN
ncbi:type II toxin-antitoxin system RelE/ParE family toxin [Bdellovibrionota bacterium FG-1]